MPSGTPLLAGNSNRDRAQRYRKCNNPKLVQVNKKWIMRNNINGADIFHAYLASTILIVIERRKPLRSFKGFLPLKRYQNLLNPKLVLFQPIKKSCYYLRPLFLKY